VADAALRPCDGGRRHRCDAGTCSAARPSQSTVLSQWPCCSWPLQYRTSDGQISLLCLLEGSGGDVRMVRCQCDLLDVVQCQDRRSADEAGVHHDVLIVK